MNFETLNFESAEKTLGVKLIPNGKGTQALHDAVVGYQANRRSGNHSTLTKAEVNRSGKKPWRQKGTGNARAGYASSPVWRGGGVVFGPKPRDYSKKIPKKIKKLALKKAFSEAAKSGDLIKANLAGLGNKTKELVTALKNAGCEGDSMLIITKEINPNLFLASRNLPRVHVMPAADVNAEDVLLYKKTVVEEAAIEVIANRLR